MRNKQPVGFELTPGQLHIQWSDKTSTRHDMGSLRKNCPCATCRVERDKLESPKGLSSLRVIQGPAVQTAQILEVLPVGRYALTFKWNDGHATGIYSYQYLLETAIGPEPGPDESADTPGSPRP